MEKYLIMVNAQNNNNKYYHMIEHGNTFEVRYGRVGKSETVREYSIYDWDKKYNEKIKKGYRDVTDMYEVDLDEDEYQKSDNTLIDNLLETLFSYSNQYLNKNYMIGSDKVTCRMIETAQDMIALMQKYADSDNVYCFNHTYERLLTTIPRNIKNVREVMAKDKKDMTDIIEKEQSKLNVMSSSVAINISEKKGETLAETMGIEIREVTKEEENNILKHLNSDTKRHYKRAFKVVNKKTAKKFSDFCKKNDYGKEDVKYMYHGSRNQNWVGILSQGLLLNPKAPITGKMFGYGIYGSPTSRKSQGYSSLSGSYWTNGNSHHGFIAVFKFAMKEPMHVDKTNTFLHNATFRKIKNKGYDSVYAHKGAALRNDEVIVYNEKQVDIEYLIEIS